MQVLALPLKGHVTSFFSALLTHFFLMEMLFLAYLSTWLPALRLYLKVKNGSQVTGLSSFLSQLCQ